MRILGLSLKHIFLLVIREYHDCLKMKAQVQTAREAAEAEATARKAARPAKKEGGRK